MHIKVLVTSFKEVYTGRQHKVTLQHATTKTKGLCLHNIQHSATGLCMLSCRHHYNTYTPLDNYGQPEDLLDKSIRLVTLSPYPLYLVDKESGVTSVQGVQWELPGIFHTNLLQELKRRVMCYISCTQ